MLFEVNGAWAVVLGWPVPSFPLLMGLGVVLSMVLVGWLGRGQTSTANLLDTALAALVMGLVCARVEHVAQHWAYFRDVPAEAWAWRFDGLEWRGALAGGALGVAVMALVRRWPVGQALARWAVAVPVMLFMGWWACMANACGYGAEVSNLALYPPWLVWEAPGLYGALAPRWRTQALGMALAVLIGVAVLVMLWRGWRGRLVVAVGLTVLGMGALDLLRGDVA
jgi:prolipoprotein diacylglyceryltransferase